MMALLTRRIRRGRSMLRPYGNARQEFTTENAKVAK